MAPRQKSRRRAQFESGMERDIAALRGARGFEQGFDIDIAAFVQTVAAARPAPRDQLAFEQFVHSGREIGRRAARVTERPFQSLSAHSRIAGDATK